MYEKRVLERAFHEVEGKPVLHRRYSIRFADRGYVLWRQHRPTVLYVNKTYKDLIEGNRPTDVRRRSCGPPPPRRCRCSRSGSA